MLVRLQVIAAFSVIEQRKASTQMRCVDISRRGTDGLGILNAQMHMLELHHVERFYMHQTCVQLQSFVPVHKHAKLPTFAFATNYNW